MKADPHPHAQLIDQKGGSKAVAQALNLTSPGSLQRVSNWKRRGIPELVMLKNPGVFSGANSELKPTPQKEVA